MLSIKNPKLLIEVKFWMEECGASFDMLMMIKLEGSIPSRMELFVKIGRSKLDSEL